MSEAKFTSVETGYPKFSIALIAKRTYQLTHGNRAQLSDEQIPLTTEVVRNEDGMLVHDIDLFNYKYGTDVVIKGAAYAPEGRKVRELTVSARVEKSEFRINVFGNRVCRWNNGRIHFSEPEPFVSMPLDYAHAYGGSDESARTELDTEHLEALKPYITHDLSAANLCVYRRNSNGKGYLIHEGEHADGMQLPNLEDPDDLLTPETLAVEDANKWYYRPRPVCYDWLDIDDLPRAAYLGLTCDQAIWRFPKAGERPIQEELLGYFPPGFLTPKPLKESFSERVVNGASVGLIFPFMKGNEEISLVHMDPEYPTFTFRLPDDKPRFFITPLLEKEVRAEPRLHSIIVEKEQNRVSLVWGAEVETKYPYGTEQTKKVEHAVNWAHVA